jgi:hypothetical protein
MTRLGSLPAAFALAALSALGVAANGCAPPARPFPAEASPEGAYARVAVALSEGRPRDVFPFVEDEAQWAAYTIRKERLTALERARRSFPKEALAPLEAEYGADAVAPDGADVFVRIAKGRGWFARLKRDLSGVARAEVDGDRATIVTARGSRYPMRRRTVGLWGFTAYTAELTADAERATRDRLRVEAAARDYDLARGVTAPPPAASASASAAAP